MTVIPIKNGTTSITIQCATLTQLEYCRDDEIWMCEYSNWAYGLFAMAAVVILLLPLLLIINCIIKYQHRHKREQLMPNYSRQTSYSSIYPVDRETDIPIEDEEAENGVHHHKQKKGKLYFPYPAYGTFDEPSFLGSTSSLYPDLTDIVEDVKNETPQSIPIAQSTERQPLLLNISSSAPVVTTMLRDSRQQLCEQIPHVPYQKQHHSSIHSLNDIDNKSESSLAGFQDHLRNDMARSFPASTLSAGTTTELPSVVENINNKLEDGISSTTTDELPTVVEFIPITPKSKIDVPENSSLELNFKAADLPEGDLNALNDELKANGSDTNNTVSDKNRILSATPVRNMISRQDFDDYLADCVLKLPEDQRNGTFLIRNSTSTPNSKVLTLYCKSSDNNATLYYFKIHFTDDEHVYLENTTESFPGIDQLIEFHKLNRSILPCLLGDCLGRNF